MGRLLDTMLEHGLKPYYETIYGEKVTRALDAKLTDEFDSSILSFDMNISKEFREGIKLLHDSGIAPVLNTIALNQSAALQTNVNGCEEDIVTSAAKTISEIGEIRIKVPSVHPAAVATFKCVSSLVNKYGGRGTSMTIDCSSLLGIGV